MIAAQTIKSLRGGSGTAPPRASPQLIEAPDAAFARLMPLQTTVPRRRLPAPRAHRSSDNVAKMELIWRLGRIIFTLMPKIVISYRRTEPDGSGRIYDRLKDRYGANSVFRDIDKIPFGIDFRKAIDEALGNADVLVAVVGPKWKAFGEDGAARIHHENDLVRIEIETALRKEIPLIPILVGGAKMPEPTDLPESIREFSFRNAAVVDSGVNFESDTQRIMRSIDLLIVREPHEICVQSQERMPATRT